MDAIVMSFIFIKVTVKVHIVKKYQKCTSGHR
jgi:hypothetical protein